MTGKSTRLRRSLATLAIASAAPANTAAPAIAGTPREGDTLVASNGTWSGSPTSFGYAWSSCDRNGNTCKVITGATAQTYAVQAADVGGTLRVTVTAKNADGSTSATSAPTAVVASANGCPAGSGTIQVA